ncbi:MAG TPA: transcriptional regulator, partial [Hyphomonas sp.]|nr:transcriptional regulator [Hyphomonas sp.]
MTDTLKQLSALGQETRLLTFRALMEAGPEGL